MVGLTTKSPPPIHHTANQALNSTNRHNPNHNPQPSNTHLRLHAIAPELLHLLAAAPEEERVPDLEPDDVPPCLGDFRRLRVEM